MSPPTRWLFAGRAASGDSALEGVFARKRRRPGLPAPSWFCERGGDSGIARNLCGGDDWAGANGCTAKQFARRTRMSLYANTEINDPLTSHANTLQMISAKPKECSNQAAPSLLHASLCD